MLKIEEIETDMLNSFFNSNIVPRIRLNNNDNYNAFSKEELTQIEKIIKSKVTVLGFDIYKYSHYSGEKQPFIPHLFELIYNETWNLITQNFDFLFQNYRSIDNSAAEMKHDDYFIDTGDGGFQLFESPLTQ